METPEGLLVQSGQVVTEGPFLDAADTVSALETLSAFETIVDLQKEEETGDDIIRPEERVADLPSRSIDGENARLDSDLPAVESAVANLDGDVTNEPIADPITQSEEELGMDDENAMPNVSTPAEAVSSAQAVQGIM